ncbi:TolC family protein, partial [Cupriavidus basilensis]
MICAARVAWGVDLSGDTNPVPLAPAVPATRKPAPAGEKPPASGWNKPAAAAQGTATSTAPAAALSPEEKTKGLVGPGFSLWELSEELRANNPQLIQARSLYMAAKAIVPQIAAPNNPQVGFIWGNLPKNSPLALARAESFSYTLTQSFPFPGKKALAADIANTQAESIDAQRDALYLQLYAQLSTTYFQALAQKAQLDVLRLNLKRLEQVKQVARIRYANNAAGYVDYLNAQVAQSSAQNDMFGLERQYDNALKSIN